MLKRIAWRNGKGCGENRLSDRVEPVRGLDCHCGFLVPVRARWRAPFGMRGFTILELIVAVVLAGLLMAIAAPRGRDTLDRTAVRAAAADVRATLGLARAFAVAGQARVVVDVDTVSGTLKTRVGSGVPMRRPVGETHGVRLSRTRDSLVYDAHGMGWGATNLSIVVRRRSAAETVFVSRLGRVR